jgi:hypothetical protein
VATIGIVPRAAFVSDVSASGVGVVTTHPMAVGSVVPIWLALGAGSASRQALVRVVHATAVSPDLHRIGLVTLDEGGEALFAELLGQVSGS